MRNFRGRFSFLSFNKSAQHGRPSASDGLYRWTMQNIPTSLIRIRFLQAAAVLAAALAIQLILKALVPDATKFFPPIWLVLLVALSAVYAALVWRPKEILTWLFPGFDVYVPLQDARESRAARINAWVSVVFAVGTLLLWIRFQVA